LALSVAADADGDGRAGWGGGGRELGCLEMFVRWNIRHHYLNSTVARTIKPLLAVIYTLIQ